MEQDKDLIEKPFKEILEKEFGTTYFELKDQLYECAYTIGNRYGFSEIRIYYARLVKIFLNPTNELIKNHQVSSFKEGYNSGYKDGVKTISFLEGVV